MTLEFAVLKSKVMIMTRFNLNNIVTKNLIKIPSNFYQLEGICQPKTYGNRFTCQNYNTEVLNFQNLEQKKPLSHSLTKGFKNTSKNQKNKTLKLYV